MTEIEKYAYDCGRDAYKMNYAKKFYLASDAWHLWVTRHDLSEEEIELSRPWFSEGWKREQEKQWGLS